MKLKASLAVTGEDNIKWLIIESDETDTKGYFLYYHVDQDNAFDTWHPSIDEAFEAAHQQYGILKDDWVPIPPTS
jgi:hypothetical protein